jgi:hypothetical protein
MERVLSQVEQSFCAQQILLICQLAVTNGAGGDRSHPAKVFRSSPKTTFPVRVLKVPN